MIYVLIRLWPPGATPPTVARGQVRTDGKRDLVVIGADVAGTNARATVKREGDTYDECYIVAKVATWPLVEAWPEMES